jgi:hypothetical protein
MENAKYVSCVEGALVPRYAALGGPGAMTFIGSVRNGKKVDQNPDEVVVIPEAEFGRFRKEYLRALREGSLTERTAADYAAWQKIRAGKPAEEEKQPTEAEQASEQPSKSRKKKSKGAKA